MNTEKKAEKRDMQDNSGNVVSRKPLPRGTLDVQQSDGRRRNRTPEIVSCMILIFSFFFFYGKQTANFIASAFLTYTGYGLGQVSSDNVLSVFTAGLMERDENHEYFKQQSAPVDIKKRAAEQKERDELFPAQQPASSSLGIVTMQGTQNTGGMNLVTFNSLAGNNDTQDSQSGQDPYSSKVHASGISSSSFDQVIGQLNNPLFGSFLKELSDTIYKETDRDVREILASPGGAEIFNKNPAARAVLMKYMKNPDFQKMMTELVKIHGKDMYNAAANVSAPQVNGQAPAANGKPVNNFTLIPQNNNSDDDSENNTALNQSVISGEKKGAGSPGSGSAWGSPYDE